MQNLAYELDFTLEDQRTVATPNTAQDNTDLCPLCGHALLASMPRCVCGNRGARSGKSPA